MVKNDKKLFKTNKTEQEISDFVFQIQSTIDDSIVLVCRGNKMKTIECFFDEISAVLQFPYYFSGNGNSFNECICDLTWIFRKKIFVFITRSEQVASEKSYDFLQFFERSVVEVPSFSLQYDQEDKDVYYIFQNIDQDFPLFEGKELSDFI